MRLNLSVNGILIASAPLDPSRCKDEYYLQAMRRLLRVQNQETLTLIPYKPVFTIEVPSAIPALTFKNAEHPAFTGFDTHG